MTDLNLVLTAHVRATPAVSLPNATTRVNEPERSTRAPELNAFLTCWRIFSHLVSLVYIPVYTFLPLAGLIMGFYGMWPDSCPVQPCLFIWLILWSMLRFSLLCLKM